MAIWNNYLWKKIFLKDTADCNLLVTNQIQDNATYWKKMGSYADQYSLVLYIHFLAPVIRASNEPLMTDGTDVP